MPTPPTPSDAAAFQRLLGQIAESLRDVSNEPDAETLKEEQDLDRERAKALLRSLHQDIEERKSTRSGFSSWRAFGWER
jgi:hypothetical protein